VILSSGEAENQSGRMSMQTAANNNLVLTDFSSFRRFADSQGAISYGGFYQQLASELVKGAYKEHVSRELGDRLVVLAEQAHAFRQMDVLEQVSQILLSLPLPRRYETVGRYYQAICTQRFGRGDVERAASLLETVLENAPPRYRVKAMISLGANSRHQCDNQSALSLYRDAARFISLSGLNDTYATIHSQKMVAVINSEDGNHRDALTLLENLFPLAHAMRSGQPHVHYDYMNSLAVELCEVGRLEEAKNVSRIVLASPFASAYPEWRETHNEIELRGLPASRSVVACSKTIAEGPLSQPTVDVSVSPAPFEGGNVLRLPLANRGESLASVETSPASQPARVLSLQEWKEKMAKQSNGDPQDIMRSRPATSKEREDRIKEMQKLGTRGMLLRAMEILADDGVSDDQLRRALIILEGLKPEENHGA
jgi:hypothetical protein